MKTSQIAEPGSPFQLTFDWGTQKTLVGGVVGGGLQYAVGGGVSVGVEYLYTQYAGRDSNFASCSPAGVKCAPLTSPFPNTENHDYPRGETKTAPSTAMTTLSRNRRERPDNGSYGFHY